MDMPTVSQSVEHGNEYANKTHFSSTKSFRPGPVLREWRKGQNGLLETDSLFEFTTLINVICGVEQLLAAVFRFHWQFQTLVVRWGTILFARLEKKNPNILLGDAY